MPSIQIGKQFPNFEAKTTQGKIDFYDWKSNNWAILFSHPADYTPVCTTELGECIKLQPEFEKRGTKMIALSVDSVTDHLGWTKDIESYCGMGPSSLRFPIIDDSRRELATELGMIDADETAAAGMPLTCRAVFIVGPDNKTKLFIYYPATTGRNFDELLRVLDSLQLTAKYSVATPANWKAGDNVMIPPTVSESKAAAIDPNAKIIEVPSKKSYLRVAKQPNM